MVAKKVSFSDFGFGSSELKNPFGSFQFELVSHKVHAAKIGKSALLTNFSSKKFIQRVKYLSFLRVAWPVKG